MLRFKTKRELCRHELIRRATWPRSWQALHTTSTWTRETIDTARITEYERQMLAGEKRIIELERQLGGLEATQELFVRFFG